MYTCVQRRAMGICADMRVDTNGDLCVDIGMCIIIYVIIINVHK